MKQRLTPNYDHRKVANPTCADLVDVFEDAWKGYVLAQVETLLNNPDGDIAAMTLLSAYFESIEALHRGTCSEGHSREFFVCGFLRVFDRTSDPHAAEIAARSIYRNVRCGVAHTGFPTRTVHFHRMNSNAFIVTYPLRPDGQLDTSRPVQSVLVNAARMHAAVDRHLHRYLEALRRPDEVTLRSNFDRLMRSSWGIGEDDNVVGMPEEEFLAPAPRK